MTDNPKVMIKLVLLVFLFSWGVLSVRGVWGKGLLRSDTGSYDLIDFKSQAIE